MKYYMYGAKCSLGDKYDQQFQKFIKNDSQPSKIKKVDCKSAEIDNVFELSTTSLISFPLGKYLDETVLKILEFLTVNDDEEYYRFMLTVCNKKETCSKFKKTDDGYSIINGVEYGVFLNVIFPKNSISITTNQIEKLLKNEKKLTEEQKNLKCKVLLNTTETKEMTLDEIFQFKNEFLDGKHEEYQNIVAINVDKNKESTVNIDNEQKLKYFLTYLYTCYVKIETKLEKRGYPLTCLYHENDLSIKKIILNLENVKNQYKTMNKNDFFAMYPIMKTLFWSYFDYLKHFIENRLDIDEGEDLPGTWEEIQTWLVKLNNWAPVKINNHWYSVNYDNLSSEPLIHINDEINGLFGFIKINSLIQNSNDSEGKTLLNISCPLKCSDESRIWICYICGEIVKQHELHVICNCGKQIFDPDLLICNNKSHQELKQQLPDDLKSILNHSFNNETNNNNINNNINHNINSDITTDNNKIQNHCC